MRILASILFIISVICLGTSCSSTTANKKKDVPWREGENKQPWTRPNPNIDNGALGRAFQNR